MTKKNLTEKKLLEGMTSYTAHPDLLSEVSIKAWTEMLEKAELITLNDAEYEKFVTYVNSGAEPAKVEALKKLFKRKAPWE
ncbi:hypothetical protein [Shewanella frigidimarina]|uniref:Uncharacterized protein n=1 Tax=Shewanella frigidimarina TaxID=56812 RepID=A0A106C2U4_SHEFR|nr:hypothetical protein [Shewanella frigidimarina]KVX03212.1 hypothetical protein AWJ07_01160 [Shewanella frigidimarina]